MGMKSLLILSFTLVIAVFDNDADALVGFNKYDTYLRKYIGDYSRRFLVPLEKGSGEHNEVINNHNENNYDEIVNKIRLENLDQSLSEETYRTNWIINKIVSIPKYCFGLDQSDKSRYFVSLVGGKDGESENRKFEIVTKIASLENLEQSLGEEMFKVNWILNKIVNTAKRCFGIDASETNMVNDDVLLNKIYDEILNKTARIEILKQAFGSKMNVIDSSINKVVNIAKNCFKLDKSHPKHSRRFLIPIDKENDALTNRIYEEISNKTARLEILQESFSSKMYQIKSLINKTVDIAEYCFGLERHQKSLTRQKRDVTAPQVSKNDTKAAEEETSPSRRSLFRGNEERNEIQLKLLNYVNDTFAEIENKMAALNATKAKFVNDDHYKVGYIMSNIDTLEVNMGNIQRELEKNKALWSNKQILDVYDTVIKSNKALSNLLNILNLLTSKQQRV